MMSFRNHHDGFGGQLAPVSQASNGATLPWWVGQQLLYGEPMGGQGRPASREDACQDGQLQVVPRAQALLDMAPVPSPQQQLMSERGIPEVMKFSMAHGKGGNGSEHTATISMQSPFVEYSDRFELGLGQTVAYDDGDMDTELRRRGHGHGAAGTGAAADFVHRKNGS